MNGDTVSDYISLCLSRENGYVKLGKILLRWHSSPMGCNSHFVEALRRRGNEVAQAILKIERR